MVQETVDDIPVADPVDFTELEPEPPGPVKTDVPPEGIEDPAGAPAPEEDPHG